MNTHTHTQEDTTEWKMYKIIMTLSLYSDQMQYYVYILENIRDTV